MTKGIRNDMSMVRGTGEAARDRTSLSTHIWFRKAWNWHKGEALPAFGPLTDIMVHVTSNAL